MKRHHLWIGLVVALLLGSVATQAVLIVASIHDPSFAVEPDYERKAAEWDAEQRRRERSRRLGWTVDLDTRPGARPGEVEVQLAVFDRYGKPVRGAVVHVETFHNARAAHVVRAVLGPSADGDGYAGILPLRRPGLWEFRLRVERDGGLFLHTLRKSVAGAPRGPARAS